MSREDSGSLIQSIAAFLFLIYGFFMFALPEKYPAPFVPQFTPLIGLGFMGIGLFLLLRRRRE